MRAAFPLSLLLGLAGFFAGRELGRTGGDIAGTAALAASERGAAASGNPPAAMNPPRAEELAQRLDSALRDFPKIGQRPLRMLAIYRAVRDASDDQFPALLERLHHGKLGGVAEALGLWWERSPDAARAWFEAQPYASHLFATAIEFSAARDALETLHWLAAHPHKRDFCAGSHWAAFQKLATGAPRETWEFITREGVKDARHTVLTEWARTQPAAAAAAAENSSISVEDRQYLLPAIARRWARDDPAAAQRWAESIGDSRLKLAAQEAVGEGWAARDQIAGLEYLASLSSANGAGGAAYVSRFSEWVMKDPTAAMDYASRLPPGLPAQWAHSTIIDRLAASDIDRAVAYWKTQAWDSYNASSLAVAMGAKHGLPAAIRFLQDHANGRQSYLLAEEKLTNMYGWNALAEAMLPMPASEMRNNCLERAAQTNAWQGNFQRAEELASALPKSAERDRAFASLANSLLAERGPDAAARWLLQKGGDQEGMIAFARRWMYDSPGAARAWVRSTSLLTDENKSTVLKAKVPW
jgi:hypothetical protein